MLLGVDVGGTFTDAVLFDGRTLHTAKAPTTPDDQSRGVLAAIEAALERAGSRPGAGGGVCPRHDRGHQRPAGGARRAHGPGRHRGLHRPARGRSPGPPRPLSALRAEAGRAGARRAPLRGPGAHRSRGRGRAARGGRAGSGGGLRAGQRRPVGGRLPAVLLPRPRARARDRRAPARRAPGPPRLGLARGAAAVSRVRALLDHGHRRLPVAPARPLPGAARRGRRRARPAGAAGDEIVGRRRARRGGRPGGSLERALGPRGRRGRRRPAGHALSGRERGRARHGRHLVRRLRGRRRQACGAPTRARSAAG